MISSRLVTSPTSEPLTLQQVRDHLRIIGTDEDDYLTELIAAARAEFEELTGRQIMEATWEFTLSGFREYVALPIAPIQEITAIQYYDTLNIATPLLVPNAYFRMQYGLPYAYFSYPYYEVYDRHDAIKITAKAGYAEGSRELPAIRRIVLLMIGDWYVNREDGARKHRSLVDNMIFKWKTSYV